MSSVTVVICAYTLERWEAIGNAVGVLCEPDAAARAARRGH